MQLSKEALKPHANRESAASSIEQVWLVIYASTHDQSEGILQTVNIHNTIL